MVLLKTSAAYSSSCDETDINTLTPVEALMKLNEMKNIVKQYRQ
jgi:hypothetical protein